MDKSDSYQVNNERNIPLLRELAGKSGTFIEKITDTMHIGLLPSTLGKLKSGILDNLNNMLRKYDTKLDGILVGYDNMAMLGSNGLMIPGYHHIHINIRADFYVFKPVVGGTLTGTVLKKSGSNATCLTNKVFTVFVTFPPHLRNSVQLHQEITFTIEKIDLLSQIPFVKGALNEDSLAPESSGSHVRFDSPEPAAAEPDSGLSSIEEGSLGRSPAGDSASDHTDSPRPRRHKKRRDRQPEPEEPRRAKKRRRDEADAGEVEREHNSPRRAKKRLRGEPPVKEETVQELYLADPQLPRTGRKKRKRESAELNGSVSGMLR